MLSENDDAVVAHCPSYTKHALVEIGIWQFYRDGVGEKLGCHHERSFASALAADYIRCSGRLGLAMDAVRRVIQHAQHVGAVSELSSIRWPERALPRDHSRQLFVDVVVHAIHEVASRRKGLTEPTMGAVIPISSLTTAVMLTIDTAASPGEGNAMRVGFGHGTRRVLV